MSAHTSTLVRYLVTLSFPQGQAELEVPTTLGEGAAMRRARMSAVAMGWCDMGEARVVSTRVLAPGE